MQVINFGNIYYENKMQDLRTLKLSIVENHKIFINFSECFNATCASFNSIYKTMLKSRILLSWSNVIFLMFSDITCFCW